MTLTTNNSDDLTAREIFLINFEFFKGAYPHLDLVMRDSIVYLNGEALFNTEGYNLLYNLTRLCNNLKDELI